MKTTHTSQLFLTIVLVSLISPAFAATGATDAAAPERLSGTTTCHVLMTEQECCQYKAALAQMNPGPARDSYLAERIATMQEREAACSCNRKTMDSTFYPSRRQAWLRF